MRIVIIIRVFCDGTRRYGLPAPFLKRRKTCLFNVYFEGIIYLRTGTFLQRRPSLWGHNSFSPSFRFPPIFEKISDSGKFSKFYFFPKNFSIFIRQNFWWPFVIIDHKFRISPYFPCFSTFPPSFTKIIISHHFEKFPPPCFRKKFTCFLHTLCV